MPILPLSEIDEPIHLGEYDPAWADQFANERARIIERLGPGVVRIEHFGSTAVPGMVGKPIVDLLVGVRSYSRAPAVAESLERIGYQSFGEAFFTGRFYLRRRGELSYNAAVAEIGGEFWSAQLAVRDYLRAHPVEVAEYSERKRRVYGSGHRLFSTYSQQKAPYLSELVSRAKAWANAR